MFTLKFKTGNAVFQDFKEIEIERILKEVSKKVINGTKEDAILDINGNIIGQWKLK